MLLLGLPQEFHAHAAHAFLKRGCDPLVPDGDAPVDLPAPALEGHPGQRGDALEVQPAADVLRVTDAAAGERVEQHHRKPQGTAQRRSLAHGPGRPERIVGRAGHLRHRQKIHLCIADHIVRHLGIDLGDSHQNIIGILGRRTGDPQGKEVRVLYGLGRDAAVETVHSHGLTELCLHELRLDQIRERLGQLLRCGLVVVTGAAADVGEGVAVHLDGERHL